jgi:hypothetical protein
VLLLALGLVLVDAVVVSFRDTWQRHSPDDYAERLRGLEGAEYDRAEQEAWDELQAALAEVEGAPAPGDQHVE